MDSKPWLKHYDPGVPAQLEYPDIALFRFLDEAAARFPERPCTIFEDQIIRYREMKEATERLAASLRRLGVQKGERVGLIMPNIPQFVLAYYAVLRAGGIVVAMNPHYKERELLFHLSDSGAQMVIALEEDRTLLESIQPQTQVSRLIFSRVEDAARLTPAGSGSDRASSPDAAAIPTANTLQLLDLIQTPAGDTSIENTISGEDEAIFQYSGGTTGTPKAAIGLHRNLVANTIQFRRWLSGVQEGEEVVLAAIPLFHVYGMVIAMSMGVALGASLVLIPDARNTQNVLRNIDVYQATLFPGVPNLYLAINRHPEVLAGKYRLQSIKACISGSAPLLREIKAQFEALTGGKLLEGYGLSEAPTATHCNPMLGENRSGSIGLPLPDVEARIVDLEEGKKELAPGEAGELIIRGPQVMKGYHNQPEETQKTLRDGWLYTGDIARMDEDGYFYIVDRKKDLIKIGGLQVWPREVEEVIAAHPQVAEVGVAGVPHSTRGEMVKAWVVLKPAAQLTAEEIKAWCRRHLANYKAPSEVEFCEGLPRTTVGKVLCRVLVQQHLERSKKF